MSLPELFAAEDKAGRKTVKVYYLDASALVKLFIDENGSETLRKHVKKSVNFCATSFCLGEALGVMKRDYFNKPKANNYKKYLQKCRGLMVGGLGGKIEVEEMCITKGYHFVKWIEEAEAFVGKYKIDFVDALQLVTLLRGQYAHFAGGSKSILITADEGLAKAATGENVRVWDILKDKTEPTWK